MNENQRASELASAIAPPEGGCVISRPKPFQFRCREQFGFTLMSDLHIGSAFVEYGKIREELQEAKIQNDRILLNGDLVDLVLPSDSKRFSQDALHSKLHGRKDVVNAALDFAVEILGPYAGLIDVIGVGNHEGTMEHYHSIDIGMLLTERLSQAAGRDIDYGGPLGFSQYRWQWRRENKSRPSDSRTITIFRYHGVGGSAPVTKGMIDFARLSAWVDADIYWLGHKHSRFSDCATRIKCPKCGDNPDYLETRQIMTGAYSKVYYGQNQSSLRRHGRRANYAADKGLPPKGIGGARVVITPLRGGVMDIKVIQ